MKEKEWYAAPNIEIILYSTEDIVRTSGIDNEVGGGWDEDWGTTWGN